MIKGSALPLEKGLNKITTGTIGKPAAMHCDADGTLDVTWMDDTVTSEAFVAGEDRALKDRVKSVDVTTGTFSFAHSMVR